MQSTRDVRCVLPEKEAKSQPGKGSGLAIILLVFGGLFVLMFASFGLLFASMVGGSLGAAEEGIGVIEVLGPISDSKDIVSQIRKYGKDEQVLGVVVRVDSPGGAVAPSQEIYDAVKRLREKKPVAVSMGGTAASGGYYIACGSDKIFANLSENTSKS